MAAKSGMRYRTKNRDALVAYLQSREGEHVTVNEIHDHFRQAGSSMGLATIYRQLEHFVEDGRIQKYLTGSGDSACYAFVENTEACESHFHCKCEECGRLIHLDCDELREIRAHLLAHHGFSWDTRRTVFYGLCGECRSRLTADEAEEG
jgi:Fur family ferric uptake transcriptional regulator